MNIRRLKPSDAAAFQTLRLQGLREAPTAFGSSYEEECDSAITSIEERLAHQFDRGIFGAFENNELLGLVALGRENPLKLAHKAFIWGMYVTPPARGKGWARALLLEALTLAKTVPHIQQINLCVNAHNATALKLYKSLGFEVFGHETGALLLNGELHDELHMCLQLKKNTGS